MTNTLEETYKRLVTQYQDINQRNAVRIGRASGRLYGIVTDVENNIQLTDFAKKILLRDLKYIQQNINDIEL